MIRCLLCEKKFKTERGLSVHLARTHDIHGSHGRLSLKTIQEFFPLLNKRRWTKAEKMLKQLVHQIEEDDWVEGYIHALNGMIAALNGSHSPPQPYIIKLNSFSNKKLHDIKDMFTAVSNKLNDKSEFDAAYFQAWEDFTQYFLRVQKEQNALFE